MNWWRKIQCWLEMGVDPGEIERPEGVTRRDFLKALGVASVTVSTSGLLLPKRELIIDPEKDAIDAVNEFTRRKMREDGFYRRLLPPLPITNDHLDRSVWTNEPDPFKDEFFNAVNTRLRDADAGRLDNG